MQSKCHWTKSHEPLAAGPSPASRKASPFDNAFVSAPPSCRQSCPQGDLCSGKSFALSVLFACCQTCRFTMTRVCYTTIPTGRPYNNLFPCASFKQTDNFYGKASQRLAEQQQHCTLQIPSMPQLDDAADGTASSTLQTLSEALADLNMDIHRTIPDPAAIVNSLATTRFCSKQVLKWFASQFKPAASKSVSVCQPAEVNNCDKMSVQDLLDSMPTHGNLDSCSAVELETPLMPPTALQV